MRMPLLVAAAAFPWLLACSGERAERPAVPAAPPPADTIVASDTADAVAILARLRTIAPAGGSGFDAASAPTIDPAAVLAVVSDSGLTLNDTNLEESATVQLSRRQIESQLARRRGRAFTSLVHLGYIYSQPYPQYSKLTFTRRSDVLEASVANWYRLGFVREGGRLRLRRVDYTMHEGEQARR
jgi:hypothetical protein